MRFIAWNVGLATALLLSAAVLPHSAHSLALTAIVAVLIGTVGIAAPGIRGLRFANAALALVLGWASLLMADVSWPARLSNMLVAAAVLVLALVPGRSTHPPPRRFLWLAWRNPAAPAPVEREDRDRDGC